MKHILGTKDFESFFNAIYGYSPFPWQQMLLEQVVESSGKWPDLIDLPTASGKTACMDIALFALAMGKPTPRRIWFVVDRRIVVDEAFDRANKLAKSLLKPSESIIEHVADNLKELGGSKPLEVARLRGGSPRSVAWDGNPAQPAIITSTVDQFGSRLLFRGYGVSQYRWPIHAALAGMDSLLFLDEAHLARPFYQTVQAVEKYRKQPWLSDALPAPFKLVVMSATPPEDTGTPPLRFPLPEQREKALDHKLLLERRKVLKPTELVIAAKPKLKGMESISDDELVVDASHRAHQFAIGGRQRIAVMVNRVRTACEIFEQLQKWSEDKYEVVLITGRLRPVDRDQLMDRYKEKLKAGSNEVLKRPIIIVTTQCLEVGADFSFDALVSESASLDALRQRFGRLARLGMPVDAVGVILIRAKDVEPKKTDPIYGNALPQTWKWLNGQIDLSTPLTINMGIDAFQSKLETIPDIRPFLAPQLSAPILLPAYLDMLCQTSPQPSIEPDLSLFLHGIPPADQRIRPEVRVVWRDRKLGSPEADGLPLPVLVEALPPISAEMLTVPLSELRRVLSGPIRKVNEEESDVEGSHEGTDDDQEKLIDDSFVVVRAGKMIDGDTDRTIRPQDVVVLPADHPSFKALVLMPDAKADVYEQAYQKSRGVIRRLHVHPAGREEFDPEWTIQNLLAQIPEVERSQFNRPRYLEIDGKDETENTTRYFYFTGSNKKLPVDAWDSDFDEDELLTFGARSKTLAGHTTDVRKTSECLVNLLPESLREPLLTSADLHDLGKADSRFQVLLYLGRTPDPNKLKAKSNGRLNPADEKKLRDLAGLPRGFRHENVSVQLAQTLSWIISHIYCDLIMHLIASHHGRCRCFADVIVDEAPPDIKGAINQHSFHLDRRSRIDSALHRLDSGTTKRFWALTRKYGWWGLAYLEAILRCADMHASAISEPEVEHGRTK